MISAVCTLFEDNYHHGVAALTNSLHKSGFRGIIYAGYRGELPEWSGKAVKCTVCKWENASILDVAEGLQLAFLPLDTDHHLTNYKPDFMLELVDGPAKDTDALFYFDPDICVTETWPFFEDWVGCGVALCEDVNSPLPEHHPQRVGWRRYYALHGLQLRFRASEYINGGFVGVGAGDRSFLDLWKRTIDLMADEIGSLGTSTLTAGRAYKTMGFARCFDHTDQDALNAAIECCENPVSVIGQEAMAFKPGAASLPHAIGAGKPWQRNYLRSALRGMVPRAADKAFWANVTGPIEAFGPLWPALKKMDIAAGVAIGRFLRRT